MLDNALCSGGEIYRARACTGSQWETITRIMGRLPSGAFAWTVDALGGGERSRSSGVREY
jgi:hypothetical protein